MSKVESTPEMASKMYAAMEERLAIVRKRLELNHEGAAQTRIVKPHDPERASVTAVSVTG